MKPSYFLLFFLLSFGTACTDDMDTTIVEEAAPSFTTPFEHATFFLHIGIDYIQLEKKDADTINPNWIKSVEVWEAAKAAEKFGTSGQYEAIVFVVYPEKEEQVLVILGVE